MADIGSAGLAEDIGYTPMDQSRQCHTISERQPPAPTQGDVVTYSLDVQALIPPPPDTRCGQPDR